jgi:hypothetical protein
MNFIEVSAFVEENLQKLVPTLPNVSVLYSFQVRIIYTKGILHDQMRRVGDTSLTKNPLLGIQTNLQQ